MHVGCDASGTESGTFYVLQLLIPSECAAGCVMRGSKYDVFRVSRYNVITSIEIEYLLKEGCREGGPGKVYKGLARST